ncbi:Protein CBG25244 [Caenorhabditis briggsae]|uniref:Protein CBG25244 n=1 Tax=Caenorhabditis briggsae TaxID=6238 RepID=B6IFL4_CAEBR|nr:Protein CBG25244 [Caenorhabditis briggsae]CAR98694.1 Protein CBG25244 [Caenorhabditis briggsae]
MNEGLSKKEITKCFEKQDFIIEIPSRNPTSQGEEKDPRAQKIIEVHSSDKIEDIPDPSSLDVNKKTLIIFDDLLLEKQNKIEQYYTRGRHSSIDCFYISQNYIKLPKNTIRENANFFIIFPQDKMNLDYIYRDHCNEIKKEEFLEFTKEVWSTKYNFLTIDKSSPMEDGRFRKCLKYFYIF